MPLLVALAVGFGAMVWTAYRLAVASKGGK